VNTSPLHLPQDYHQPGSLHRYDYVDEKLYAILACFNPVGFRSRWKNHIDTVRHLLDLGFYVIDIECSLGQRQEVLSKSTSDKHTVIHVYSENELWLKENLYNLAAQYVPKTAKYLCFIDDDIQFTRSDIVGETLRKLQHYHVVQMFSVAFDMTPNYIPYQINYGFMHDYINGVPPQPNVGDDEEDYYCPPCPDNGLKVINWHPGYCWGYTMEAFNALGGLIDWAILGSADRHMATALIGTVHKSCPKGISPEYKDLLEIWQQRALDYIKKDVGYIEGTINHFFHGAKANRRYKDRWKILVEHKYTPSLDLKRFYNGTFQLTDRSIGLRDDIRQYFAQRSEDSLSLEGHPGFLPLTH
jgi:hypothetical protein